MVERHINVVIVGAGAGGGIVAKELSEAGLSSVLLERGGWPSFESHDHDELSAQTYGVLRNAFGPDDERYRRVIRDTEGNRHVVTPIQSEYGNIAACVGSGTASYGAMAWRFMPQDFRMRTVYGVLEDSTLDDWPGLFPMLTWNPSTKKLNGLQIHEVARAGRIAGIDDRPAGNAAHAGDRRRRLIYL